MAREPPSLYNACLVAYVKNLNYKVTSMDRTYVDLRMLPTAVLASVYEQVSELPGFRHRQMINAVVVMQDCQTHPFLDSFLKDGFVIAKKIFRRHNQGHPRGDKFSSPDYCHPSTAVVVVVVVLLDIHLVARRGKS